MQNWNSVCQSIDGLLVVWLFNDNNNSFHLNSTFNQWETRNKNTIKYKNKTNANTIISLFN